jgi:CheY-like chemotaxis protein
MSYLNARFDNSAHTKKFHQGTWGVFVASSDLILAGKRCLVLDDEFLIAIDIQEILEAAGVAKVVCVADAASALAALQGEPRFDIAILDVLLRDVAETSLAVATVLAAQKIPFVFLTGMPGDDIHTRKFPGAPVLEKPYQAPLLLETILRALGQQST